MSDNLIFAGIFHFPNQLKNRLKIYDFLIHYSMKIVALFLRKCNYNIMYPNTNKLDASQKCIPSLVVALKLPIDTQNWCRSCVNFIFSTPRQLFELSKEMASDFCSPIFLSFKRHFTKESTWWIMGNFYKSKYWKLNKKISFSDSNTEFERIFHCTF